MSDALELRWVIEFTDEAGIDFETMATIWPGKEAYSFLGKRLMRRLLKLREVAARLNVSLSTVYNLAGHQLPVHRVARVKGLRIAEDDLDAYLEKSRQVGASDAPNSHVRLL
jgi:excisionase family DNA binding protein